MNWVKYWRGVVLLPVLWGLVACGGRESAPAMPGAIAPPDPLALDWPLRRCATEVAVTAPGAASAMLQTLSPAGQWVETAMTGGVDGRFSLALETSPAMPQGARLAYRFAVDGALVELDAPELLTYVEGCPMSALEIPACDDGPLLEVERFELAYDEATNTGRLSAVLALRRARDEAALAGLNLRLDDAPVAGDAVEFDVGSGVVHLRLDGIPHGKHVLAARLEDAKGRPAPPVDLPFWVEAEPFDWRDATLYMVLVDRYANGNPDNDWRHEQDVPYATDYHGGDLEGLRAVIESGYFEELGVDAIWLSPVYRQTDTINRDRVNPDFAYSSYHGYWNVSGREVDRRYGGDEALRAVIAAAHARGIRILFDLIANQVHVEHELVESRPDFFRSDCICGIDEGCGWSEKPYTCMFNAFMPDIDWTNPEAERQFIADAVHWVSEFGVDGFRVDAVKHIEPNAITNLRAELARRFEQGGARIMLLGETAVLERDGNPGLCGRFESDDGYGWINAYVGPNMLDGQFDFVTFNNIHPVVEDTVDYRLVDEKIRRAIERFSTPELNVQFLGSHDEPRMASRAARDPARRCRWAGESEVCARLPGPVIDPEVYARLRRSFTLLLTMPGIPMIYAGDEVAVPGGWDPDNRRDMHWSEELAHLSLGAERVDPEQAALRRHVAEVARARDASAAIRRGERQSLLVEDDVYVYAYRHGDELALIALNRGAAEATRTLPEFDRVELALRAGQGAAVASDAGLRLSMPAGASAVWLGRSSLEGLGRGQSGAVKPSANTTNPSLLSVR